MQLRDYLRSIRRQWLLVVAIVVLAAAIGVTIVLVSPKRYEASAQIFVATTAADSALQLAQGNTFSQARVQTYVDIAKTPAVTDFVVSELGLSMSGGQLAAQVTADAPEQKSLINIHVVNRDPELATRLTNAVASRFTTVVEGLEKPTPTSGQVVNLTVTQPASVPTAPVSPRTNLIIGVAVLLGLLVGLLVVVLRDRLDTSIKSADDVEAFALPLLTTVPYDRKTGGQAIVFRTDNHGARAEAFRQLRINLRFIDPDNPPRVIAVTSAVPAEGKSTTAINLAAALAESGNRVCLIDADLRRPTIAKNLGLVGDVGFTSALIGEVEYSEVLQNAGENLAVMTSGAVPPNPSELLESEHARKIIDHVASMVDFVLVDTAPLLPVSDGAQVASIADATILVTRSGKTTRAALDRSLRILEAVGVKPTGVVLNMARSNRSAYGSSSYYEYYTPK